MRTFEGELNASGLRFGMVVSRFNLPITERLLDGALECLEEHGAQNENITVAWVPGAFELPLLAKRLAESGKVDAVVCIGAVIRGETAHFEYVSAQTAAGILQVSLSTNIPIIYSVLATENLSQAEARAGNKEGNAGYLYARAAIEMVNVLRCV